MSRDTPKKISQHERFVETARALGCDEDKSLFDVALEKIATHKPKGDGGDHLHQRKGPPRKPRTK